MRARSAALRCGSGVLAQGAGSGCGFEFGVRGVGYGFKILRLKPGQCRVIQLVKFICKKLEDPADIGFLGRIKEIKEFWRETQVDPLSVEPALFNLTEKFHLMCAVMQKSQQASCNSFLSST